MGRKGTFFFRWINIISCLPETGEIDFVLSDVAQAVQESIKKVEQFMDEQLRPYYDTSLNGKDKGIIASLIAAQFFPEYILPKWLQPAKQFKQYLAGAGAVTGALLTGNPIGALMGAMLGYLSPSLGALGYYSRKKSRKSLQLVQDYRRLA